MTGSRSLLVTGGAGFIGSAFVRHALAARPTLRVVTLDALTYAGDVANLADLPGADRHHFVHGDIRDVALVRTLLVDHDVDTVVHFAAESHVDRSIEGPLAFVRTNVEGTTALLMAAREVWQGRPPSNPARFHHVSTDEVYGDLEQGAAVEGDAFAPSSPYAASKAAAEHLVRAWRRTYGLPVSITVASNTYGPRQYPEKLLPVVIRAALEGRAIPLYGDGLQRRDWLFVDDHVEGVLAVLERGAEGGTWHLSSGQEIDNRALVGRVCALLDEARPSGAPHARLIASVTDRPGHDRRYALDASRAARELGWYPQVSLETGLRQTVDWYLRTT